MNKLFWETVTENMRLVMNEFSQTEIGALLANWSASLTR